MWKIARVNRKVDLKKVGESYITWKDSKNINGMKDKIDYNK
jgi:hypothetical protein